VVLRQGKTALFFGNLAFYIKTCLNRISMKKLMLPPLAFFSAKIKKKKLIPLEFAALCTKVDY